MNKLKYFACAVIAATMMTSCEKEEMQTDASNGISSSSVSIANEITVSTYKKYANISDAEFFKLINPIKQQLIENKQLSPDKSGEAIPLGDIFFFHEGAINSIHTQKLDDGDEVEHLFSTFNVPIHISTEQYFVEVDDYNEFYSQIVSNIQTEVNLEPNQYLVVADLSLVNVTSISAEINVMLSVGTSLNMNLTIGLPTEAIHGADMAGYCGNSNLQGFDAGLMLGSYMYYKGTAGTTWCPQGQSSAIVLMGYWNTTDQIQNNTIFGSFVNVGDYYWQSHTNSCIGNSNDVVDNDGQWNLFFSKAEFTMLQARDYFRIYTGLQSLDLLFGTLYAGNQGNPYTNAQGRSFYHSGIYYYGNTFCE